MNPQSPPAGTRPRTPAPREWLAFAALMLLAVILYLPALDGPLLHDDTLHLGAHSSLNWQSWSDPAIEEALSSYPSRILGMGSFGVQHMLFGDSIRVGKAINLAIHLLNALLLLLVVFRLAQLTTEIPEHRRGWLAVVVAGLWLLHPLQVSTVAYSVQRITQLSTFFTLLAMLPWLAWLARGRPLRAAWLALLALSLTVPAYYCKENGALVPLFLLLCLPLAGWRPAWPRDAASRAAVLVLLGAGLLLAWEYLPRFWQGQVLASYRIRDFDLGDRLLTEPRVLAFYLSEIAWPDPSRMSLHLDGIPVSRSPWSPWTTLPSILFVGGMAIAGALLLRQRRLAGFGLLFFLAGHLLESTVIGLEIAYEHRNYLPMAGILLALGSLVARWPSRTMTATVATGTLLACALTLAPRAAIWSDAFTLHADMVTHHPQSSRAHYALAREWLARGDRVSVELALHHLRRSASLNPSSIASLHVMASLLPPGSAELEAVWNEMYARARFAAPGRGTFNPLQDMTQCVVEKPDCPLPAANVERLFRAALANPGQTTRFFRTHTRRLFGTLLVRAVGKVDEGLALSRAEATPACPRCRVSYLRNLVAAGKLAEARTYYPQVEAQGRLRGSDRYSLQRAMALLEERERAASGKDGSGN